MKGWEDEEQDNAELGQEKSAKLEESLPREQDEALLAELDDELRYGASCCKELEAAVAAGEKLEDDGRKAAATPGATLFASEVAT